MGIRKEMQELEKGSNNKNGLKKKVIKLDNNRWEIMNYSKKIEETKINIKQEPKEKGDEKILIGGDFNARLGDKGTRIIMDTEKRKKRESKHKTNNNEGKILWKIIEEMGWEILNGNKEGDKEGARGESIIIDYGIVNEEAWEEIESIKVGERVESVTCH
ncbi:hypothetical protein Zmor_003670 [Zophobas morio]|uniref:Endonuclease/exonuclease/phosphatase domain-containing protein n=1 Tax=Zophobas morio TaxID=2755281 RepID=A0AA38HM24_9CUCU|nr:hypothetical protein Zmor_003670 [Zophobas morio]